MRDLASEVHVRDAVKKLPVASACRPRLQERGKVAHQGLGGEENHVEPGPGILTERDILLSNAAGQDPDTERVGEHLSSNLTFASPDWSLERAAEAMVKGGFRHLVVVDNGETVGILSIRDIVRCWTQDGATSSMPREEANA